MVVKMVGLLTDGIEGQIGAAFRSRGYIPGLYAHIYDSYSFQSDHCIRSYDYGAPISENRLLTDKYDEVKRQGIFLRSSPEFRKTDWIGDSATGIPGVAIDNDLVYGTYLKNPDSGTGFLITRQNDSTSTYVLA